VIYRPGDRGRLAPARLRTRSLGPGRIADHCQPGSRATPALAGAIAQRDAAGQPFVFVVKAQTGRGKLGVPLA
jgi:hypothetical protein